MNTMNTMFESESEIMNNLCWESVGQNPNPKVIQFLMEQMTKDSTLEDKINWEFANENPAAIKLLQQYPHRISLPNLARNPEGYELLKTVLRAKNTNTNKVYLDDLRKYSRELCSSHSAKALNCLKTMIQTKHKNVTHVCKTELSRNPTKEAIEILMEHPHYIDWDSLCSNPSELVPLLITKHLDKIHWGHLCGNSAPWAVDMVFDKFFNDNKNADANLPKTGGADRSMLSANTSSKVVNLLITLFPEKIDWRAFSSNSAPEAVCYLELHPEKIHWYDFSYNTSIRAIQLLKNNPEKIHWDVLSYNHALDEFLTLGRNVCYFPSGDF